MAKAVITFLIRMPPELHEALSLWAREEDRSLNNLIVRLLRQAVSERVPA